MTSIGSIGLRLRFEDMFIVVAPRADGTFDVMVTDAIGRAPQDEAARRRALQHLLREISSLRGQVWVLLGGEVLQ